MYSYIPHWYCTPCMFYHIIMHSIRCIYPPEQVRECFSSIFIFNFILFFMYVRPLFKFSQFSTLLLVTFVLRQYTNVSRSGRPYYTICKIFSATLWKTSFLFSSNNSASYSKYKIWYCAGEVTSPSSFSPKASIFSIICPSISISIFLSSILRMFIPRKACFFPCVIVIFQSFLFYL